MRRDPTRRPQTTLHIRPFGPSLFEQLTAGKATYSKRILSAFQPGKRLLELTLVPRIKTCSAPWFLTIFMAQLHDSLSWSTLQTAAGQQARDLPMPVDKAWRSRIWFAKQKHHLFKTHCRKKKNVFPSIHTPHQGSSVQKSLPQKKCVFPFIQTPHQGSSVQKPLPQKKNVFPSVHTPHQGLSVQKSLPQKKSVFPSIHTPHQGFEGKKATCRESKNNRFMWRVS